jgi:RNA polymerase sigma-70 factor (ECF subfamily)
MTTSNPAVTQGFDRSFYNWMDTAAQGLEAGQIGLNPSSFFSLKMSVQDSEAELVRTTQPEQCDLRDCPDEQLVALSGEGSEPAFEELVLRHRRMITGVSRRFFPNSEDAEDVAQDAFVKAFTSLDKLKDGVPFRHWLVRLTINLCLDRLRKEKRRRDKPVTRFDSDEAGWLERQLSGRSLEELDRMEGSREARELLGRVLGRVSAKDQAILKLLYGEGMQVSQVAELLGLSAVNVRVRAFRARRTVRGALERLLGHNQEQIS